MEGNLVRSKGLLFTVKRICPHSGQVRDTPVYGTFMRVNNPSYVNLNLIKECKEWRKKESVLYKQRVKYHKKKDITHPIEGIENINSKDHHLDHKVSIIDGFNNFLPYMWVRHHSNLRIIPKEDNVKKGKDSVRHDLLHMIERLKNTSISRF